MRSRHIKTDCNVCIRFVLVAGGRNTARMNPSVAGCPETVAIQRGRAVVDQEIKITELISGVFDSRHSQAAPVQEHHLGIGRRFCTEGNIMQNGSRFNQRVAVAAPHIGCIGNRIGVIQRQINLGAGGNGIRRHLVQFHARKHCAAADIGYFNNHVGKRRTPVNPVYRGNIVRSGIEFLHVNRHRTVHHCGVVADIIGAEIQFIREQGCGIVRAADRQLASVAHRIR